MEGMLATNAKVFGYCICLQETADETRSSRTMVDLCQSSIKACLSKVDRSWHQDRIVTQAR